MLSSLLKRLAPFAILVNIRGLDSGVAYRPRSPGLRKRYRTQGAVHSLGIQRPRLEDIRSDEVEVREAHDDYQTELVAGDTLLLPVQSIQAYIRPETITELYNTEYRSCFSINVGGDMA